MDAFRFANLVYVAIRRLEITKTADEFHILMNSQRQMGAVSTN